MVILLFYDRHIHNAILKNQTGSLLQEPV